MYPQSNLIVDSSFENQSASWNILGGATRIMTDAYSGNYAINAVDNSGANQTITGLTPNTTYLLTGWLKSSNSSPVVLGVKWFGGNELSSQTTSSEYVQLSVKFTTGPASTSANIYVSNPANGSNIMFADELSLTYTAENQYALVWSDEFNGSGTVNSTNWSFEYGFVRNEEIQWYQYANASQVGGNLIIEGQKENPINTRLNPGYVAGSTDWKKSRQYINYTSSSIKTVGKQSWLYGRFEIRAKVTNLTGTWPAIWTLGNSCESPSNGEVDENRMSIYLDGELLNEVNLSTTLNGTAACSGQNPFKQKHFLLLNLALGSNGGSVTNLSFPTQYIVDYVRVYQKNTNLAVNEAEKDTSATVFPNPVKNVLTIDYSNENAKYKVYDVSGKILITGNGSKVDFSKLNNGVYFVQVENLKPIKIIKE